MLWFFPSVSYPVQFFYKVSFDTVELICYVCHVWRLCRLLLPQGTIMKILEKEACRLKNEFLIYVFIKITGMSIDEFSNGI